MTIIVTAIDGNKLRGLVFHEDHWEFMNRENISPYVYGDKRSNYRMRIFPEAKMTAQEQSQWMKECGDQYDVVVTFSPWIVSDARKVIVIDKDEYDKECNVRFGDSVNAIIMRIWRNHTIGQSALDTIDQLGLANADVDNICKQVGDSIERTLLIHNLMNNIPYKPFSSDK